MFELQKTINCANLNESWMEYIRNWYFWALPAVDFLDFIVLSFCSLWSTAKKLIHHFNSHAGCCCSFCCCCCRTSSKTRLINNCDFSIGDIIGAWFWFVKRNFCWFLTIMACHCLRSSYALNSISLTKTILRNVSLLKVFNSARNQDSISFGPWPNYARRPSSSLCQTHHRRSSKSHAIALQNNVTSSSKNQKRLTFDDFVTKR